MKYLQHKLMIALAMTFLFNIACAQSGGQNGQKQGPPTFEQLLEQMDADNDGLLSLAEIEGPLANDFDKVDLNEDGFINKEEFEAAPKPQGPPKGK